MKKHITFLFSLVLNSCSQNPIVDHRVEKIEPNYSLSITLNGDQYENQGFQLIQSLEGENILYGLDKFNSKINRFSLSETKYLNSIDYSDEKHNIVDINHFYVQSVDSIFLFSSSSNIMYLINNYGYLSENWELDFTLESELEKKFNFVVLAAATEYNKPFIYNSIDNSVYFSVLCYKNSLIGDYAYSYQSVAKLILSNEVQKLVTFADFPDNYKGKKIPYDICFNLFKVNEKVGSSFLYNSQVFLDNKYYSIKSKFDPNSYLSFNRSNEDPPLEKQLLSYNTDFSYVNNFYHKEKNYLLRVCKHKQDEYTKDNLLAQYMQSSWSIIVYDLTTNLILKELLFDKELYSFQWVFTANDGFYLLRENTFNDENEEDILNLDYFTL